jgi:Fe2+ transport system protein B
MRNDDETLIASILMAYHDYKIDFENVPALTNLVQNTSQETAKQVVEAYLQSLSHEELIRQATQQAQQMRDETKQLIEQNQQILTQIEREQAKLRQEIKDARSTLNQETQKQRQELATAQNRLIIPAVAGFGVFLVSVVLIFLIFFKIGG